MLLSLLFLPMIKRRIYEAFLLQHHICAIIGLIAIWKHIQRTPKQSQWWLISCVAAFSSTGIFQGVRIIYRNFVFGGKHKSVRMSVRRCTENIVHATLDLPRPWTVRAGERVNLGVPSLGVFYFFQTHPFTITWWEENQDGSAFSITLMFRARNGFTRKLYTDPKQDYWAWIDGPFGPSLVQEYGLSRDLGDYGHILMVTTGVGIAAQLPYIKELLHRRDRAEIRTQKISLVWQIDCTGDWKSTREWLQLLVRQDKGCVSYPIMP
jgi:predicted ferric reductase